MRRGTLSQKSGVEVIAKSCQVTAEIQKKALEKLLERRFIWDY